MSASTPALISFIAAARSLRALPGPCLGLPSSWWNACHGVRRYSYTYRYFYEAVSEHE